MSKNKKKVPKLTDEQYNEYIATLKNDAALYSTDGTPFVPKEINPRPQKEPKGK